jgi:hypothetical protein
MLANLAILFASGALIGRSARDYWDGPDPVIVRPIFDPQPENWKAYELCSAEALEQASALLDLDLSSYKDKCASGLFKVITITQPGAPLHFQVVIILESHGPYTWRLYTAYHPANGQVEGQVHYDRIHAIIDQLNEDCAADYVEEAKNIRRPEKRFKYMVDMMGIEELGKLLSTDHQWQDLLAKTQREMSRLQMETAR